MNVFSPTVLSARVGRRLWVRKRLSPGLIGRRGVATALLPMLFGALLSVGCGATSGASERQDAAPVTGTSQLQPVGTAVRGLKFGESGILMVRFLDASGAPAPNVTVGFSLVGDAGGSALAATAGDTGADGVAGVTVRAGHREATFEVRAHATSVADVLFVVLVSESGAFADLSVRMSAPSGMTLASQFEIRLYDTLSCADLDPVAPPAVPAPRDLVTQPDAAATFTTLLTSRSYAVLAVPIGLASPVGCVDVLPGRLLAGATTLLLLPLHAPIPELAAVYQLATRISLDSIGALERPLGALSCPNSPSELLLDCIVDAADLTDDPDGIDCVPGAGDLDPQDYLNQALLGGRDWSPGCRGQPGDGSLEAAIHDRLPSALAAALAAALAQPAAVSAALRELRLESTLTIAATGSPDQYLGRHTLNTATIGDPNSTTVPLDLATIGLPHRTADGVPIAVAADGTVTIATHDFSLRLGTLARRAVDALLLSPNGLATDSDALVTQLVDGLTGGAADACAALDAIVCTALGAPFGPGCLGTRCTLGLRAAPGAIDASLAALNGGADLALAGSASAQGSSGIRYLSSGAWIATIGPAATATIAPASFTGGPVPTPIVGMVGRESLSNP